MSYDYGARLFTAQAKLLADSGIDPDYARLRDYRTIDTKVALKPYGIAAGGRNTPGLLIPLRRIDGSVWGHQYRPSNPRLNAKGKPIKYETPTGQRNGIDFPVGIRPMIEDPSVPLWVTEGTRKADCAFLRGLCCVAIPGVWSWIATNAKGGKAALPEWHDIPLNGRRVILCWDSDVTVKPAVRKGLEQLANYLTSKGAQVEFCHLPDNGDGKVGLDDYLMSLNGEHDQVWLLVRPDPPELVDGPDPEPEPEPEPEPTPGWDGADIDGASLLDKVEAALRRFVAFPSRGAAVATALWVVHTHCMDAFDTTPRLAFLSPEPQSGKTRGLEVLEHLSDRPMFTANTTVAVLARGLDSGQFGTVLLDEADTVFGSKAKGDEELRGLLNSGDRRGANYMRMVGEGTNQTATKFRVFAPAALAGIGDLPETVMQRAVVLRMRRRGPAEHVEPFRLRKHRPALTELAGRIHAWAAHHTKGIEGRWPDMPEGVTDRPADVWEPLLAIADEAGGHWPKTARDACVKLLAAAQTVDSGSLGIRLLADLRGIWQEAGDPDGMHTDTILERLLALDEAPWGDLRGKPLDARGLGRQLRPYGVASASVRVGETARKGYRREDLHDVWMRYLPPPPSPGEGSRGSQGSPPGETRRSVAESECDPETTCDPREGHSHAEGHTEQASDLRRNPRDPCDPPVGERGGGCTVCGKVLAPLLVEQGYTAHPRCT